VRSYLWLAGDGGDTDEFAFRVRQQVGETEGVVEVGADVGVYEDLMRHGLLLSNV
jgi:hypothetical protein